MTMHIISLGAGVQSSTVALMAAAGQIMPMPTASIFSDTQAEPKSVYTWLDWLVQQLPFQTFRVTSGSLTKASLEVKKNRKTGKPYYSNLIPAFIENPDGTKGIVGRHCTKNHKLDPLMKQVRLLIGKPAFLAWRRKYKAELAVWRAFKKEDARVKKLNKKAGWDKFPRPPFPSAEWKKMQADPLVVQWIGISLDEVSRMKPSREPWCVHRFPLIEMEMTRHDCILWMQRAKFPEPPRSACTYCPFHSDHEWRRLKEEEPAAFAEAVKFERDLQNLHAGFPMNGRIKGIPFLHDSLKPLDKVDFSLDERQGSLKFVNECEGMCGV